MFVCVCVARSVFPLDSFPDPKRVFFSERPFFFFCENFYTTNQLGYKRKQKSNGRVESGNVSFSEIETAGRSKDK